MATPVVVSGQTSSTMARIAAMVKTTLAIATAMPGRRTAAMVDSP